VEASDVLATAHGTSDSNHNRLNNDLGLPDDPATQELFRFVAPFTQWK
jgi:hypothetical protein